MCIFVTAYLQQYSEFSSAVISVLHVRDQDLENLNDFPKTMQLLKWNCDFNTELGHRLPAQGYFHFTILPFKN